MLNTRQPGADSKTKVLYLLFESREDNNRCWNFTQRKMNEEYIQRYSIFPGCPMEGNQVCRVWVCNDCGIGISDKNELFIRQPGVTNIS